MTILLLYCDNLVDGDGFFSIWNLITFIFLNSRHEDGQKF